jgi:hypothetical protein
MIFNVLTKDLKDDVRKEYRTRRFILYFLALDLSLVLFLILLIPSYFSLSLYKQNLSLDAYNLKNSKEFKDADSTIQDFEITNRYLDVLVLKEATGGIKISDIIKTFLDKKNSSLLIKEVLYSKTSDSDFNIVIRGLARDRESLISFTKALSENNAFKVDLPVSNFTKDKNIDFTFTVIKNDEKK